MAGASGSPAGTGLGPDGLRGCREARAAARPRVAKETGRRPRPSGRGSRWRDRARAGGGAGRGPRGRGGGRAPGSSSSSQPPGSLGCLCPRRPGPCPQLQAEAGGPALPSRLRLPPPVRLGQIAASVSSRVKWRGGQGVYGRSRATTFCGSGIGLEDAELGDASLFS